MSVMITGRACAVTDVTALTEGLKTLWPTAEVDLQEEDRICVKLGNYTSLSLSKKKDAWIPRWDNTRTATLLKSAGLPVGSDIGGAIQQHALAAKVRTSLKKEGWKIKYDSTHISQDSGEIVIEVEKSDW